MDPVSLWMLAAHFVADFPLQPDWMARKKAWLHSSGDRPEGAVTLFLHVVVHGVLFAPIAFYTLTGFAQVVFLTWIMFTHFAIDSQRWVSPKEGWGHEGRTWVWLNDQIFHLVALALAYPIVFLIV